jgi:hypothetical protein
MDTDSASIQPPKTPPLPGGGRPGRGAVALGLVAAAAVLAAGMVVGLLAVGDGLAQRSGDGVVVTGSARVDVTADRAVWVINASEQAPDLASAVTGVQRSIDAVSGYLTAGGVPADAITLEALGTSINYVWLDGTQTSDIASYSAYRSMRVRLDDVQLIDRLSRDFGDLLATGIAVNAWAPEYYVTTLPDLRPALLEQAVADALVRAEAMVGVVGGTVGDVRAIRSGPFQVSTRDSVDVSDYGMYDTTTIEKTVTATVSVTFAVD